MTNYLEVKNLSKSFDSFQLHNISFTLPKGYIMGLAKRLWQDNHHQTHSEYAQAQRRRNQNHGAG